MNSSLKIGIPISDWQSLTIGQIVNVIITDYNGRLQATNGDGKSKGEPTVRMASQSDWDSFSN